MISSRSLNPEPPIEIIIEQHLLESFGISRSFIEGMLHLSAQVIELAEHKADRP